MAVQIETPQGLEALTELILFHNEVYAGRGAYWPANLPFHLPILTGESPFNQDRQLRPFLARDGGRIVARAVALLDERYQRHWNERLGHVFMFEALPETRAAVKLLMG